MIFNATRDQINEAEPGSVVLFMTDSNTLGPSAEKGWNDQWLMPYISVKQGDLPYLSFAELLIDIEYYFDGDPFSVTIIPVQEFLEEYEPSVASPHGAEGIEDMLHHHRASLIFHQNRIKAWEVQKKKEIDEGTYYET